jgi:type I restriction enzyme, R subunit
MIKPYGSEDAYQRQIMQQFLGSDKPELFIVVDDLLDSFDAPVNAVLYLARQLSGHTMLQAVARVARVNRTSKAKPFGRIIDYTDTLGQLDQPLTSYPAMAGFSQSDLEGTYSAATYKLLNCHLFMPIAGHYFKSSATMTTKSATSANSPTPHYGLNFRHASRATARC